MRSDLIKTPVHENREDWLEWRRLNGIGGSEIGTIFGWNPYECKAELFLKKLGIIPQLREENIAMFMGNQLEDLVADLWQYADPACLKTDPKDLQQSIIFNKNAGAKMRSCRRMNFIAKHPDYDFLFCNVDRTINRWGPRMSSEGVLEVKTISSWSAKKWESGVPTMYVGQLQLYMLVLDLPYGELAILKDGREIEILPFEASPTIQQQIIEQGRAFWENVKEGRRILAAGGTESDIEHLMPEPEGTDAYEEFVNKRFSTVESETIIEVDEASLEMAIMLKKAEYDRKQAEKVETLWQNRLKDVMRNSETLHCGDYGKISWKADKNGKRTFRTGGLRVSFEEEIV